MGVDQPLQEIDLMFSAFHTSLTKKQSDLLGTAWQHPRRKVRNDEYPAKRARRWVFARTLSLGWTPKLFGSMDRTIGYKRGGREEHKAERWGKKYQWMAYHELLARVADNYQPSHMYGEQGPYEGLHQIIADREIDPSLPPIGYRAFAERSGEGDPTWSPSNLSLSLKWPPARIDFRRYQGSIDAFIDDRESEPTLDKVAIVIDDAGHAWVVLDAHISQGDPEADKSWLGLQQKFALDSWFIPRGQASV